MFEESLDGVGQSILLGSGPTTATFAAETVVMFCGPGGMFTGPRIHAGDGVGASNRTFTLTDSAQGTVYRILLANGRYASVSFDTGVVSYADPD